MRRFILDAAAVGRPLTRSWECAVGSGDAWSLLRADLQKQLRQAVAQCGFRYLRCHGILCDQLQVVRRDRHGQFHYNWRLVDGVCDALLEIGLRPFVELGFMPGALASGDQTVFHYRANVTPPAEYAAWNDLIEALVSHWQARYGAEETRQWYFEVWNEPNLGAFWSGSQADYFRLYAETARTIKRVDPSLRVGGPATTRGEWVAEFLAWCRANDAVVDFVSTHIYPDDDDFGLVDPTYRTLFNQGVYLETLVARVADALVGESAPPSNQTSDSSPRLEAHWTEWNSSWRWGQAIHDQSNQAAYIAQAIHGVHDRVDSFAFWTISDIFNEFPYPAGTLVGGFGLLTVDGLPKPGYHAYRLLHRLGSTELPIEVHGDPDGTAAGRLDGWATRSPAGCQILLSHYVLPTQDVVQPQHATIVVRGYQPGSTLALSEFRVDPEHASVLRAWQALGQPSTPTRAELALLRTAADFPEPTARDVVVSASGELTLSVPLPGGTLVLLELADGAARRT